MSALRETLLARLDEFDGKAITILGEIEAAFGQEDGFLSEMAALADHPQSNIADGATWLVKSALDNGGSLSAEDTAILLAHLPDGASWGAQLHVCQCIGRLELSPDQLAMLVQWLEPILAHQRPFLRAWSLDALWALARLDPALRDRAEAARKTALEDDAASVRARARNLA